jgi:amylosucrase
MQLAQKDDSPNQTIFSELQRMISLRKSHAIFGRAETLIVDTNNSHLFAYLRQNEAGQTLLAICNFSEASQAINIQLLEHFGLLHRHDMISGKSLVLKTDILSIQPYQFLWLTPSPMQ